MILVPIGSDQNRTRFPKLTVTLIIACFLIYVFTYWIDKFQGVFSFPSIINLEQVETELMVKYLESRGEKSPRNALSKIMKDYRLSESFQEEFHQAMREGKVVPLASDKYSRWERALDKYESMTRGNIIYQLAYVPRDPGIISAVTYMFLHSDFLHLFWNMYFLWIVGISLEDIWGRRYYIGIYLAGGMVAALAHHLMSIRMDVPMIGASGAVAALMGAYTVRFRHAKLKFVFFKWEFWVVAWIPLGFWFSRELYYAIRFWGESLGVAVWAHVGGYMFGLAAALVLAKVAAEDTFIAKSLAGQDQRDQERAQKKAEKKAGPEPRSAELEKGIELKKLGDLESAVVWLKGAVEKRPDDFEAREELIKVLSELQRMDEAAREMSAIVVLYLAKNAVDHALSWYGEICRVGLAAEATGPWMFRIGQELQKREAWEAAVSTYRGFAGACPKDPRAPKALFMSAGILADRLANHHEAVVIFDQVRSLYPEWMPNEVEDAKNLALKKSRNRG